MFCHNCGKEIPDISNYCLFCGTKIKQDTDDMSLAYPSTEKEILYETVMKERVIKNSNVQQHLAGQNLTKT